MIFARDQMEAFAHRQPSAPPFASLNTEAGQQFVHYQIAALGGVDVVIFDNLMSLMAGDQKDEVPWSDTLPLVTALTLKPFEHNSIQIVLRQTPRRPSLARHDRSHSR